jgi:hypothetical protein
MFVQASKSPETHGEEVYYLGVVEIWGSPDTIDREHKGALADDRSR